MTKNLDDPIADEGDAIIGKAFIASLAVFAVVGLAGYFGYHYLKPPPQETTIENAPTPLPQGHPAPIETAPDIAWTEITDEAGIDFRHENGAAGQKLLPETMGGGCAFFDYDNDGDPDLLFVNSRPWSDEADAPTLALFQNDGTGRFRNVTIETGLNQSMYGMGVACGDYNGDGWVDVFISNLGEDRLFENRRGRFYDVTSKAGVAGSASDWSTACGWFDADGDGDLDLFVAHYLKWSREYDLAQEFRLLGNERAYGRPENFEGTFPALFRNEGDGTFTEVGEAAGLHVRNPATKTPLAKSLGVVFHDLDRDGDTDIIVANDTVPNFLFINQGKGQFVEQGTLAGIAFDPEGMARGAMGIDSAHFRNDNSFGTVIGNFANEMTALYVARDQSLQFTDEAVSNGLGPATRQQLTFGVLFLDVDLDGRLDLFQANGHLEEDIHKVQSSQTYAQSPQLFWNAGSEALTEFLPWSAQQLGRDFTEPLVGRGAAYADIDADGDLDLVMTSVGNKPRLLRNDQSTGHNWLRVKLQGRAPNTGALGAEITLVTPSQMQKRTVAPTRSYLSQVELPVTFGLRNEQQIDRLEIRWPDGTHQVIKHIKPNQFLRVNQPE